MEVNNKIFGFADYVYAFGKRSKPHMPDMYYTCSDDFVAYKLGKTSLPSHYGQSDVNGEYLRVSSWCKTKPIVSWSLEKSDRQGNDNHV